MSSLFSKCLSRTVPLLEPSVLTLSNGNIVPYPRGSMREVTAGSVYAYGRQALDLFWPETDHLNKLRNLARLRYIERREEYLHYLEGKWIAVNPKGDFVVSSTEEEVRRIAELVFPFRVDEYFATCVGREVLKMVRMGDFCRYHWEIVEDPEFSVPPNLSSGLSGKDKLEYVIRAEHSFSGQDFKSYVMKHCSGATMMGIPREILSNLPPGVVLQRHDDVYYDGPDGTRREGRVYLNHYIRIAGVTIKVDVIESRLWVLGLPVLSRFRNILDATAKEVVVLEPLPGTEQQG